MLAEKTIHAMNQFLKITIANFLKIIIARKKCNAILKLKVKTMDVLVQKIIGLRYWIDIIITSLVHNYWDIWKRWTKPVHQQVVSLLILNAPVEHETITKHVWRDQVYSMLVGRICTTIF